MERQVREALEVRFLTSVLELTDAEREQLLTRVPTICPAVERAQEEAMRSLMVWREFGASPKSLPSADLPGCVRRPRCLLTCEALWWTLGDSNP
jgi:hypothetical protein